MSIGQTIRVAQNGWSESRIALGYRAAVYAVATAERLGRTDLAAVRLAAELGDEADEIVRLARWFDAQTYPLPAPRSVAEALAGLDGRFDSEIVEAFRQIQPLVQPVGLE